MPSADPQATDSLAPSSLRDKALVYLTSTPTLALSTFIMYACGVLLSYILFSGNSRFEKHQTITGTFTFNLALGIVPTCVVILLYTAISSHRVVSDIDTFTIAVLPCTLILCGLVVLGMVWRVLHQ